MPPDLPAIPPPLPPVDIPVSYHARTSALEPPRTYVLEPASLTVRYEAPAGKAPYPPDQLPLRDVTAVRLRYFPTRVQTNRYECIVTARSGRSWKITNEFYQGVMSFRDESAAYRPFVTELVRRVAAANPSASFRRGTSALAFYGSLTFCAVMFLLLALVLLAFGPAGGALVIVKLVIIACFIPVLINYARRSRPGRFEPHAIPGQALPRVSG